MIIAPLRNAQALSLVPADPSQGPVVAMVVKIDSEGIDLELVEHSSFDSFAKGDAVTVKFWDDKGMYIGRGDVLRAAGSEGQDLRISHPSGVEVEKRRFPRHSISIPISFTVIHASEKRVLARDVHRSLTRTISAGGAEFETELNIEDETILDMKLDLSAEEELKVMGRVVRSEKAGAVNLVKAQFLMLRPKAHQRIEHFLEEREKG